MSAQFRSKPLVLALLIGALSVSAAESSAATLTWTTGVPDQVGTNTQQVRSVAVSDQLGNNSVYVGFIQRTGGHRRVYRHDSASPYGLLNTHVSGDDQPKGIATDDRGNVFVANRGSGTTSSFIQSFSSTLAPISSTTSTSPVIGGVAIQKSGSTYFAYTVYETGGLIQRYDVTNPAAMTLDTTFGTGGSFNIPGGDNLHGIEVGADGSLYVAARTEGQVWKVSADLSTVASFPLNRAMDVALYGGKVYATSYDGAKSFIRVINAANMAFIEDIDITTLDSNPYTRGSGEGWSGIDIGPDGRIWLADQQYGGAANTSQDRLLVSSSLIPEPTSLALIATAATCLAALGRPPPAYALHSPAILAGLLARMARLFRRRVLDPWIETSGRRLET
jgi:hypothetical protein